MTWVKADDEESISIVKGVIGDAKSYVDVEVELISFLKPLMEKGVVRKEYELYASLIDDLKETIQDVESAFFALPKDEQFNASLKELEAL